MNKNMRPCQTFIAGLIGFIACCYFAEGYAAASGTPAGSLISNRATARYTVSGSNYSSDSNTNTIKVDEIVNNVMTWQDASQGVAVSQGQANQVLTMKLVNTGNGTDSYTLSATGTVSGNNFNPTVVGIYLDTNGNGVYDPGVDQLYVPGTNDPTLAEDASLTFFVMSAIPSTGLSDRDKGSVLVKAASKTGVGTMGTVLLGAGPGGTAVIIGQSGGSSSALGTYVISASSVAVSKSATVTDQYGGNRPMSGATIHYSLSATVTGSGTAMNVVITDLVPANTTYIPGTLKLNNTVLSDAADADAGDVGGTSAGTVTVKLGNLTSSSPAQTITFDVRIN
jgi:uncharacterized repeat protein (TIGR01451 family)